MTATKTKLSKLIAIGLFILTANISAQNAGDVLRLSEMGIGSNARALGMGNAYTGLSDDFSAASFNPAGLALLKRMELSGGLNYNSFNNNSTFFGNKTDYTNSDTRLDQFNFAFPFPTFRGSLVFGVGYNRDRNFNQALSFNGYNPNNNSMIQSLQGTDDVPYYLYLTDENGNTPITGGLNQDGTILSSGSIGKWAFSLASEVARNVFIGGTLNIISGNYNRSRDYYEEDTRGLYRNLQTDPAKTATKGFDLFYFNDVLDWDITGWDAKVGFLYQNRNNRNFMYRIGADVKFPSSITVKEKYTVNGEATYLTGTKYTLDPPFVSELEYDITTPFIFSGGASFGFRNVILSASASFVDYTQMEFSSGLSANDMSSNNKDIKQSFRSVLNYNLGAEYTVPALDLRLRGGFMLMPSPYKADENISDYDKKYLTAGVGFLLDEAFAIDAAYAYGWWKDIGDNYGSNVSRTFQDVKNHNMIFTFTYRF